MAAMISSAFFAVAASVSTSLLAQCADDPARLRTQARRALRIIGALLIAPVVITCLLAPQVLGLFGAGYVPYDVLLVLLLLTTIPDALINLAVAILRVQRRLVAVAAVNTTGATITIGGSWLLMPHLGINGAGWAALATPVILAAMLAVMWLYRSIVARTARTVAIPPPVSPWPHCRLRRPRTFHFFHLSSPSPRPRTSRLQKTRIGAHAHDIARRRPNHASTYRRGR